MRLQDAFLGRAPRLVTTMKPEPPNPACMVCGRTQLQLHINTRTTTLGQLVDKARLGIARWVWHLPQCLAAWELLSCSQCRRHSARQHASQFRRERLLAPVLPSACS